MDALIREMRNWSRRGAPLEKRAAAAALCEPDLLTSEQHVQSVLRILDDITASIQEIIDRKSDEFKALRKGLAYCWSVAVVELPPAGKKMMEKWFSCEDKDIKWIMKENLKKKRLARMDSEWVAEWLVKLN
jgi:hypothetical protein